MEVKRSGNMMFVLTTTKGVATCYQVDLGHDAQLWYNWLGHLSYNGFKTLVTKQMVKGLSPITTPKDLCTQCLARKQHQKAMSKKSLWRASKKLQLVHANICGPIQPTSSSNKRYIISFIYDLSHKT